MRMHLLTKAMSFAVIVAVLLIVLAHMNVITISLPYLWVAGHLTAPFGAALVLYHLFRPTRLVIAACIAGGLMSCAFLAYILFYTGLGFVGPYQFLAWAVAFLAGYVSASPFGFGVLLAERSRRR
jgi:hypothetical protein